MHITSIDNCYEEDGLVQLQSTLMALNVQSSDDPIRPMIVAILPEYSDDWPRDPRLLRLNVVTVPAEDPGDVSGGLGVLMEAAAQIVGDLQKRRAEAYAKLNAEPPIQVIHVKETK